MRNRKWGTGRGNLREPTTEVLVSRLLFHREAAAELEAAVEFYETKHEGLGLDLLSEVQAVTVQILATPRRWGFHHGTAFRRVLLRRFPYAVFYLETEAAIWVIAVAHCRRKQGYWLSRKPEQP